MIPEKELDQLRADVEFAALSLPCIVQRKSFSRDAYGSEIETWNTIETVNCGLSEPTAGQLQNYDYLIGSLAAWQVKLPYVTDVQHQDHLLITGEFLQQTLVVQVVLEPRSYASLLTVLASEVK